MKTWTQPRAARFWEAIAAGDFELPQCGRCGAWQGPDAASCERCESPELAWSSAPATGAVFSSMAPWGREGALAAVVVVVDLDAGPRLMGALAGAGDRESVGMRVAASRGGERRADGLPEFVEFVR